MMPIFFSYIHRYDHSMRETWFSIGLQGIHSDDIGRVKEIIWSTLEGVVKYVLNIFMHCAY